VFPLDFIFRYIFQYLNDFAQFLGKVTMIPRLPATGTTGRDLPTGFSTDSVDINPSPSGGD
jgi:hypothetical protein